MLRLNQQAQVTSNASVMRHASQPQRLSPETRLQANVPYGAPAPVDDFPAQPAGSSKIYRFAAQAPRDGVLTAVSWDPARLSGAPLITVQAQMGTSSAREYDYPGWTSVHAIMVRQYEPISISFEVDSALALDPQKLAVVVHLAHQNFF